MAPPTFPPVPRSLFYPRRPKTRDNETALRLEALGASRHTTYAQHLWGFTILRTVYTPESDALFPIAMRRLDAKAVTDGEPNEELAKRFYCDVIEDKDRLAGIQSDAEGFAKLRDYFREWLVSVGVQPDLPPNHDDDDDDDDDTDDPDLDPALEPNESHDDPRFRSVLVVDEECLRSLIEELSDETPPLRTAVDREEWLKYLRMGKKAWLWMLDTGYMTRDESQFSPPGFRGWFRLGPTELLWAWFEKKMGFRASGGIITETNVSSSSSMVDEKSTCYAPTNLGIRPT
ncbi:hypothetical protein QBC40DRAFT_322697 [Triangularia verruculosa]|uniref:Uncharacterized protein n=1 Tax=Triangularia verruculosa TaxID=2587418 RepID=A0AAN6X517_9PEZI|nr:hypothetical protein QBC40DRAFT_322697 [Triangularia verruculosa]